MHAKMKKKEKGKSAAPYASASASHSSRSSLPPPPSHPPPLPPPPPRAYMRTARVHMGDGRDAVCCIALSRFVFLRSAAVKCASLPPPPLPSPPPHPSPHFQKYRPRASFKVRPLLPRGHVLLSP